MNIYETVSVNLCLKVGCLKQLDLFNRYENMKNFTKRDYKSVFFLSFTHVFRILILLLEHFLFKTAAMNCIHKTCVILWHGFVFQFFLVDSNSKSRHCYHIFVEIFSVFICFLFGTSFESLLSFIINQFSVFQVFTRLDFYGIYKSVESLMLCA